MLRLITTFVVEYASDHGHILLFKRENLPTTIESESIGKEAHRLLDHNRSRRVQGTEDRDHCPISTKAGEMMAD